MSDEIFKRKIAPHFDSAYNLARWLTHSDADAADILQEAAIKAFRFLASLENENSKAWFLAIVRNTAYSWLRKNKDYVDIEETFDLAAPEASAEVQLSESINAQMLHQALDRLTPTYKEIIVLRELEEMAYEDIAVILHVPLGTVMSRLSRARAQLKKTLITLGVTK